MNQRYQINKQLNKHQQINKVLKLIHLMVKSNRIISPVLAKNSWNVNVNLKKLYQILKN